MGNNNRDYWTMGAMEKFGGSFVKALANLARRADPSNLHRIKMAWPEYWSEYEETGKKLEQESTSE